MARAIYAPLVTTHFDNLERTCGPSDGSLRKRFTRPSDESRTPMSGLDVLCKGKAAHDRGSEDED